MKRKLLSLTAALLCAVGMWAQASYNHTYTSGVEVAAGSDYFLYNIENNVFFSSGMNWGTRATGDHSGRVVTLALSEGAYTIKSAFYSANGNDKAEGYLTNVNDEPYTDNNDGEYGAYSFTAASVEGYTNAYTIKNADKYLYYNTSDTRINWGETEQHWLIIPKSTRDAAGDYSYYLQNQGMNRQWQRAIWGGVNMWEGNWSNSQGDYWGHGGNDDNPCGEKYHGSNGKDFYQTITETLPAGRYRLSVQAFYRQDDNASESAPTLYIGSDSKAISTLTGTENSMADASTSFSAGNYVNYVETVLSTATANVTLGINVTGTHQWTIWDNFSLDYLGTMVKDFAVALPGGGAMTADTWYKISLASNADYFVHSSAAAKISYTTDGSQACSSASGTDATFSAGETKLIAFNEGTLYIKADAATTIVIVAKENGANVTDVFITNPSFETGNTTGWTYTASKDDGAKRNDNATYTMSNVDGDYLFNIWDSGNTISQTLKDLPAGIYKLTAVMGTDAGATFRLMMGGNTGTASSDNKETGVSVTVYTTLAADGDLTISADAGGSQWYKVDNFILTYLEPATDADYTALNTAITSAKTHTLGFDSGEYAPYYNVAALEYLAAAEAINQSVANPITDVQTATKNLTDATWTANPTEVNAVYDGNFSIQAEHTTSPTSLKGWVAVDGIRQLIKNTTTYPGLTASTANAGVFSWQNTALTYGNTTGYTMPLAEHTIYELTLKITGWRDGDLPTELRASVLKSSDGMASMNILTSSVTKRINESDPFVTCSVKFVTGEAGNYILTLTPNNNNVITDITLFKSATVNINEDDNDPPVAGLANVTLTRTIKANKWNTFCVPFDMTAAEISDKFGVSAEVKELTGASKNGDNYTLTFGKASSIEAGKPYMVKVSSDINSISLTGKTISSTTTPTTIDGEDYIVTFTGVYTNGYAPLNSFIISNNAFYLVNTDANSDGISEVALKAFRGYITVGSGSSVKALNFVFDDNADGIKAMDNGRWTMNDEEAPIYNLAGQRIQKMQKGINIVNGKKIMK